MIVTLAGRRIDAQNAEIVRFPLAQSPLVRKRIHAVLVEQGATTLVSSATCGADLLALEVAGELGLRRRVILPFAPARFRVASVTNRPGEWGKLFDRIIREVRQAGDLVLLNKEKEDDETYLHTNRVILDEAQKLAPRTSQGTVGALESEVLAVIVWDGKPRGEGDFTFDFANEARARSIPIAEILIH